ncbi:hypothetical protein H5410_045487, partial [Solanum commersonii]
MLEDIRIKLERSAQVLCVISTPQPSIEVAGPSNLKRKARDKPVAPSKRAIIDEDEDEDELESENETTIIRPRAISEAKTRLQMKKLHQLPTCSRKINFGGMRVILETDHFNLDIGRFVFVYFVTGHEYFCKLN